MALDYTIWFSDADPANDYMWSLDTEEGRERKQSSSMPEMFAPLMQHTLGQVYTRMDKTFSLLKKTHPKISEAKRETDFVKIFGTGKKVDLLTQQLQRPVFGNRTIEESFVLLHRKAEPGDYHIGDYREWEETVSGIVNYLNSFVGDVRIVFSHDRGFFWKGSVSAKVGSLERYRAVITVTADVEPYKYERYASDEPWAWADFSFVDGIIRDGYGFVDLATTHVMEYGVIVRTGDIVPKFVANDVWHESFRAVYNALNTLQGLVEDGLEASSWESTYATTITNAWNAVKTAYTALTQSYFDIPEWQSIANRVEAGVIVLATDISGGDAHEIRYDLNAIQADITQLKKYARLGQVQVKTEQGGEYHSVGYGEMTAHNDVILKGSYWTDEHEPREQTVNRSLFFRGVVGVTVQIRGTAL